MTRDHRILLAILAAALGVRIFGITSPAPTDAEALGVGIPALLNDAPLVVTRGVAALLSVLAVLVIGLPRRDDASCGLVAGFLLACDPLAILAARESPRGAALTLACAFAVRRLSGRRDPRLRLATFGAFALAAACGRESAGVPADAALAAWFGDESPFAAMRLAEWHHIGYVAVPLALGGLALLTWTRATIALLLLAFDSFVLDAALGPGARLVDHAFVAPLIASLAATAISSLHDVEQRRSWPRLALPGALATILAVNAPVLVSDLATGLRFPWPAVGAWLAAPASRIAPNAIVHTTTPETARRVLDKGFRVEPLPEGEALAELLRDLERRAADGAPATRVIVLPVASGLAHGVARGAPLLRELERRRVAEYMPSPQRFDLHRLELRAWAIR